KISPEEIVVFAFNRKAKTEINERLSKITYDGQPIIPTSMSTSQNKIATTFHAFAYKIISEKSIIGQRLISKDRENEIITESIHSAMPATKQLDTSDFTKKMEITKQFITRAEQKYFTDYNVLDNLIQEKQKKSTSSDSTPEKLAILNNILKKYQQSLKESGLINFNQMVAQAARKLKNEKTPFSYIFVDEYQDFSLLFLNLIQSLRNTCPTAHLLCVGDDWQAINRFAGSDVEYFVHFSKYFPDDCAKLFIPTNYRSGKKIVKNANYFMSRAIGDYQGCKSGSKQKSKIYIKNINYGQYSTNNLPLLLENYLRTSLDIIEDNPGKTIKILSRNNNLSFNGWSLEKYITILRGLAIKKHLLSANSAENLISGLTIHRSKGLEADIVILLEIDAEKFPGKDKSGGLYEIFGDTTENLFADEARLFYVALTRPKEKLYILSKTTIVAKEKQRLNFFHYLNEDWLEELN
ncbi:UvrD-helicase domain-containing protein, partial [Candidatus Saccharibacteria bacterium]|nr:UvrD-helicase domain-containing protein [Candidatus Saccharibacteria bacterium]